jgi:NAD-dependent dihydropyrimidine dehydrogenase PreA subunit
MPRLADRRTTKMAVAPGNVNAVTASHLADACGRRPRSYGKSSKWPSWVCSVYSVVPDSLEEEAIMKLHRTSGPLTAASLAICLLALVGAALCAQSTESANPSGGILDKSLREFAETKGVDAAALGGELGLLDEADLDRSVAELLAVHGLSRADLREAMERLSPRARAASPRPAEGAVRGEVEPQAAMEMPFREFAAAKGVEPQRLAEALGLPENADLSQPLGTILEAYGLDRTDVQAAMLKANPLAAEAAGKDWGRIRLKFALWAAFFLVAMILLIFVKITKPLRAAMLAAAALVFGVWLGVEPNAPGTVKDGFVLYGEAGVIFRPRLIALVGFLLMSIIGNKVFCGWGCPFGTLQDLAWQIKTKKVKLPFWLTNLVRTAFFVAVAVAALVVPIDIMEPIDPFRIFRLGAAAAVGLAVADLVAGIWIYRPWCTFMCPFGFVSWFGERISFWRPRVNHNTCIDCKRCERACPTHSMEGIRAKRLFPQDCFACGACVSVCPVSAVKWGLSPPPDKAEPEEEKASDEAQTDT